MTPPQNNGMVQKTVFWLLGALFAVLMILMQMNASARSESISDVKITADYAKELSIKNTADIASFQKTMESMDKKLDILINQKVARQ
jgi:hypothetical protein